jgi:hypothetical protein
MIRGELMKRLLNLVPALSLAAAMLATHPGVAVANAVTVVATINGGGTALMYAGPGFGVGTKNVSSFAIHATLYSDHSATGHVDCVDHVGDVSAGNIFGEVTSWSLNAPDGDIDDGIVLHVTGKLITFPGGPPVDTKFPVTIQNPGGAGVGLWTLGNPSAPFCIERVISGQIVVRWS